MTGGVEEPATDHGRHQMPAGQGPDGLFDALVVLRDAVGQVRLPLPTGDAEAARQVRDEVVDQLDDYLLPRLRHGGAPLLVVVGGSTGSGKSTLVNSLLGEQVSASGVLRPTTMWPVLLHHPLDARWFVDTRILPDLPRVTGEATGDGRGLRLVGSTAVPTGMAILDAPDIDSVVVDNRALSRQLLGAADLWLFVTTAARYADAVPWDVLAEAARRQTEVAVVLDRVDHGDQDQVVGHLRQMLADHDLDRATVLVVEESELLDALLPTAAVAQVADWLTALAADPQARQETVSRTRDGLIGDLLRRCDEIVRSADAQEEADRRLRGQVTSAYEAALADIRTQTSDGSLLRGEVLARWQELIGTGDVMRAVEAKVSVLRDAVTSWARGRRATAPTLTDAIGAGLDTVVLDAAETAAERAFTAWRADPAGRGLLDGLVLSRSSHDLRDRIAQQVRGWQSDVLGLVSDEGAGKRTQARVISYSVNGAGVALMLLAFAHTGGLVGAEVGIAGGTAVLAQRLLEAVFGDDAVRRLTATAHELLEQRVRAVLDDEAARFVAELDALGTADCGGSAVRAAVVAVEHAPLPEPVPVVVGSSGGLRGAGAADAKPEVPTDRPGGLRGLWRRLTSKGRR